MTFESNLQTNIINMLKSRGAYPVNIHGDQYQSGVPDILVCYRSRFIGIEVKGPSGTLRPLQKVNLRRIQQAGGIGEAVRSVQRVEEILRCIDDGGTWDNITY